MLPAPPRRVGVGLVVRAAYHHTELARELVHDLKYRALPAAALALAPAMVDNLPESAASLVPVPRAVTRRLQLGVDPALELARVVGRLAGLPVERLLVPPLWRARHAGKRRERRTPVRFVARGPAGAGAVIVDDVVTTGATLAAAHLALGPAIGGAITATSAGV